MVVIANLIKSVLDKIAFRHQGITAYTYWNVTLIYHLKTRWHVTSYKKWNILSYPISLWINEMCTSKSGKNNLEMSKELHEDNRELVFFSLLIIPRTLGFTVRLTTELFAHT